MSSKSSIKITSNSVLIYDSGVSKNIVDDNSNSVVLTSNGLFFGNGSYISDPLSTTLVVEPPPFIYESISFREKAFEEAMLKPSGVANDHVKVIGIDIRGIISDIPTSLRLDNSPGLVGGTGTLSLSFVAPDDTGTPVTSYNVNVVPQTPDMSTTASNPVSPIIITNLINGQPYYFTLSANNISGVGLTSDVSDTKIPYVRPFAPLNIHTSYAQNTDRQCILDFKQPVINGLDNGPNKITEYKVYQNGTFLGKLNNTTYGTGINNLTNGASYAYTVSAINGAGEGPTGISSTPIIPYTLPNEPQNIETFFDGKHTASQCVLRFAQPVINGLDNGPNKITTYKVYQNNTYLGNVDNLSYGTGISNLTNGASYVYTISAVNTAGEGPTGISSSPIAPYALPNAPENVRASFMNNQTADKQCRLDFAQPTINGFNTGSNKITKYNIYQNTVLIGSVDNTTYGTGIYNLDNGIPYRFVITAVNEAGEGPGNIPSEPITPFTIPFAPAIDLIDNITTNSATINFSAPTDTKNYLSAPILHYDAMAISASDLSVISETTASENRSIPFTLNANTDYSLKLTATNIAGTTIASTGAVLTYPVSPTSISAVHNRLSGEVVVSWSNSSLNGPVPLTYEVSYTNGTNSHRFTGLTGTSYTVKNLTDGVEYTFGVYAVNRLWTSAQSDTVKEIPSTSPYAPKDVTAVLDYATLVSSRVKVTYTMPIFNGGNPISGYHFYANGYTGANRISQDNIKLSSIIIDGVTSYTAIISNLTSNALYYFTVTANNINGDNNLEQIDNTSDTILTAKIPDTNTITNVTSSVTNGIATAVITFSEAYGNGVPITSYTLNVYNSTETAIRTPIVLDVPSGTSVPLTFTVNDLTPAVEYIFKVFSTNSVGDSELSVAYPYTTIYGLPAGVTDISVTNITTTTAVIDFKDSAYTGGKIVSYMDTTTNTQLPYHPFTITGLTPNETYNFNVKSTNTGGLNTTTSYTPIITVPVSPTGIAALHNGLTGEVNVSWSNSLLNGPLPLTYNVSYTDGTTGGVITGISVSPYTVADLMDGTNYTFSVYALNSLWTSAESDRVTETPSTTPYAPTNVQAQLMSADSTTSIVNVTFNKPVSDGGNPITAYYFYANGYTGANRILSTDITLTNVENVYTAVIKNLPNNKDFTFTVQAYNINGDNNLEQVTNKSNQIRTANVPNANSITGVTSSVTNGIATAVITFTSAYGNGVPVTSYTLKVYDNTNNPIGTDMVLDVRSGEPFPLTFTVNDLTPAVEYIFKVFSTNSVGDSELSVAYPYTTIYGLPAGVTDISVTNITTTTAVIDFKDSAYTGGKTVSYNEIATDTSLTSHPFTITGLRPNVSYNFGVKSTNTGELNTTTLYNTPIITIPVSPTDISAAHNNLTGEVSVSWVNSPVNGPLPLTYNVSYTDGTTAGVITGLTGSPYTVTGLVDGTTYTFSVYALNSLWTSVESDRVTEIPSTAPYAPTVGEISIVSANATTTKVKVTFVGSINNGGNTISGYNFYVNGYDENNRVQPNDIISLTQSGESGQNYTAEINLPNDTDVTITVQAVNINGDFDLLQNENKTKEIHTAKVPDQNEINSITSITTNGIATTEVTYSIPTSDGGVPITGYTLNVYKNVTSETSNSVDLTFVTSATSNSDTITVDLTPATEYTFKVFSTNSVGQSKSSESVYTTVYGQPDPVTNVSISDITPTTAKLDFTESTYTGGGTVTYTETKTNTLLETHPFNITALKPNSYYTFNVKALNSGGNSETTSSIKFATLPEEPKRLQTTYGNGQVTVNWLDNTNGPVPLSYTLEYYNSSVTGGYSGITGTSYTVNGLTNGTLYTFNVFAVNEQGQSIKSEAINATPSTVPNEPTDISATLEGIINAKVVFTAPVDNGGSDILNYNVYANGMTGMAIQNVSISNTGTVYTAFISNLDIATEYNFNVDAQNINGKSVTSSTSNSIFTQGQPMIPVLYNDVGPFDSTYNTDTGKVVLQLDMEVPIPQGSANKTLVMNIYSDLYYEYLVTSAVYTFDSSTVPSYISLQADVNPGTSYYIKVVATAENNLTSMLQVGRYDTKYYPPTGVSDISVSNIGATTATVTFSNSTFSGGKSQIYSYVTDSASSKGIASPVIVDGLTPNKIQTLEIITENDGGKTTPKTSSSFTTLPLQPTNVNARHTGLSGQVNLSWTKNPDNGPVPLSYIIEYSDKLVTGFRGTSYLVNGLIDGTGYNYTVYSVNSRGQSSASATVSAISSSTPYAPTNVQAIVTGYTTSATVKITFTESSNDGGNGIIDYNIYANGPTGTILIPSTSYTITHIGSQYTAILNGLPDNTYYTFTVKAENINGDNDLFENTNTSEPSIIMAIVPDAVQSLSLVGPTIQSKVVSGSYTFISANNRGSPVLYYQMNVKDTNNTIVYSATGTGSPLAFTTSALTANTTYHTDLFAVNSIGAGVVTTKQLNIPYDIPYSATITYINNVTTTSAKIGFAGPTYIGGGSTVTYMETDTESTLSQNPSIINNLAPNTNYSFKVKTTNEGNLSSNSSASSFATLPLPPTGVNGVYGDRQAYISWENDINNGPVPLTYTISYSSSGSDQSATGITETYYTVTGLNNGTFYTFGVYAVNSNGSSVQSQTVSATPSTVPYAPTIVSAAVTDVSTTSTVTIVFNEPANDGGNRPLTYNVYANGYLGSELDNVTVSGTGTVQTAVITGLTNNKDYTFTIEAENINGGDIELQTVNNTTALLTTVIPPTVPTDVYIASPQIEPNSLRIAFSAPVKNGGSDILYYTVTPYISETRQQLGTTGTTSPIAIYGLTGGIQYKFNVTASNRLYTSPIVSVSGNALISPSQPGQPKVTQSVLNTATVTFTPPYDLGGSTISNYRVDVFDFSGSKIDNLTTYSANVTQPSEPLNVSVLPQKVVGSLDIVFDPPTNLGGAAVISYYTVTPYLKDVGEQTSLVTLGSKNKVTVNGLSNGATYTFKVKATNSMYTSIDSSPSAEYTLISTPSAPYGVTGMPQTSYGSIDIAFSTPTDLGGAPSITNYIVTPYLGDFAQTLLTKSGATSPITITGLTSLTDYTFKVVAINGLFASQPSSPSGLISLIDKPDAPTDVMGTYQTVVGQIDVTFTAPVITGGSDIVLYNVIPYFNKKAVHSGTTGTSSPITITGLDKGTTYTFRATASNKLFPSVLSSESPSITLVDHPTLATIDSVTQNVPASVILGFSPPKNNGGSDIVSYTITYLNGSTQSDINATTSPVVITGLTNKLSYTFKIKASNRLLTSNLSSYGPVTIIGNPSAPRTLAVIEQTFVNTVTITFDAPEDNGGSDIVSYTLTPSRNGVDQTPITQSSSPFTLSNLVGGSEYVFKLTATNSKFTSESASITYTVVGTPSSPGKPEITQTEPNNAIVTFSTPSNLSGSTIYNYRVTVWDGELQQSAFTKTSTTSPVNINGLLSGTAYTFKVVAYTYNGKFNSAESVSDAYTILSAPGKPLSLSWNSQTEIGKLTFSVGPSTNLGGDVSNYYTITPYTLNASNVYISQTGTTGTNTSITVSGLSNVSLYTFTVKATNRLFTSVESDATSAITLIGKPDMPTGVTGTIVTPTSVNLSFTRSVNNGGSSIYTYTIIPYLYGTIEQSGINTVYTSKTITGLTGASYTFTVTATNTLFTSDQSTPSSLVTLTSQPGAPTEVTSVQTDPGVFNVSFKTPTNTGGGITYYTVYPYSGLSQLAGVTGTSNTIYVSGLTVGTSYTFKVTASNALYTSLLSSESTVYKLIGTPGVPTIGSVNVLTSTSATVSFTPSVNTGGSLNTYTVTAYLNGGTTPHQTEFTGSNSPITVSGLSSGAKYTFRVFAKNTLFFSTPSNETSLTDLIVAPDAPTMVSALLTEAGVITVTFTPSVNDGGSSLTYTVTPHLNGITQQSVTSSAGTTTGSNKFINITGLVAGSSYTFNVKANNSLYPSSLSGMSSSVSYLLLPSAPTIGTATMSTATSASVTFTPTPVANNGGATITSYTATAYLNGESTGITASSATSPITVNGLTNTLTYTFKVTAYNGRYTSLASTQTSAITLYGRPDAPTLVSAILTASTTVTVTFTPPVNNGGGVPTYTVTPYVNDGAQVKTTSGAGTPTGDGNFYINVTSGFAIDYYNNRFTVKASNALYTSEESARSSQVFIAFAPIAPTIGTASQLSTTSVAVSVSGPVNTYNKNYNIGYTNAVIVYYTVYAYENGSATPSKSATGSSPITISDLTFGSSYTFKATAFNSYLTSPLSTATSVVNLVNKPDPPTPAGVLQTAEGLSVRFKRPVNTGGTPLSNLTYVVTPYLNGVTAQTPVTSAGVAYDNPPYGDWSVLVSGLTISSSYTFSIKTYNGMLSDESTRTNSMQYIIAPTGYLYYAAGSLILIAGITNDGGSPVKTFYVELSQNGQVVASASQNYVTNVQKQNQISISMSSGQTYNAKLIISNNFLWSTTSTLTFTA